MIDFEGTRKSGIVEYGIVTLEGGAITETYTRLCQPVGVITVWDTRQHGIRFKEVQRMAPFSEDWELFSTLRARGPFSAHHAVVENALLKDVWPYPRRASPLGASVGSSLLEWGPWVDTRHIFATGFPDLKQYRLGYLIDRFRLRGQLEALAKRHCPLGRRRPHAALYDAIAAALLLQYLGKQPGFEHMDLDWLRSVSTVRAERRQRLEQSDWLGSA